MGVFTGSFQFPGDLILRLTRQSDQEFLFSLFVETRPWLSWAEGDRDFIRTLYEQQYDVMRVGQENSYPEHIDLVIERSGDRAGRVVVDLGYADWHIAELQVRAAARGAGIGSDVIRGLQAAASRAGMAITMSTPVFDPRPRALYERLGFRVQQQDGPLYRMIWAPHMPPELKIT